MELKDQMDSYGAMPDLNEMLEMCSNKDAYRFYWMVFGPHVYGKDTFRKEVFAPYMDVDMSRKVFTENDEAWGLLVLEDNWEVWWEMAVQEYRVYMKERRVEIGDNGTDDPTMISHGEVSMAEDNALSLGGAGERRKIARKMVLTQLYSSRRTMGLGQQGFDRLEVLEDKVHEDRNKDNGTFFEYVKQSYVRDQGSIKKKRGLDKDDGKTIRALRMM